jgi:hypothetical protein
MRDRKEFGLRVPRARRGRPARASTAGCTLLAAALAVGCRGEPRSGGWAGRVDTLPTGTLVVRNPAAGVWDSASAWRLEEDLRIGAVEGAGPDVFGEITDVAVDTYGRIYVLDRQAGEVRVFGPDGTYVRTIGRKGEGPGEFRDPIGLDWDPEGRLWVCDPGNGRYTAFDTAGAYAGLRRREIGGYTLPWPGGFDERGRLYDATVTLSPRDRDLRSVVLVRMDTAGAPSDTVHLPEFAGRQFEVRDATGRSMIAVGVPFSGNLYFALDRRGFVWSAWTADYRIHQQALDSGDTVRIVERETTPVPVTDEEIEEAVSNLDWFVKQGGKVDRAQIPRVHPPIDAFGADPQGYLWVFVTTRDRETRNRVFDVFDPAGRYLGAARSDVTLQRYPPPVFTDTHVYGVTADTLGAVYVVRTRIVRPRPTD